MVVYESCHKNFLRKQKIQKLQAPDRQHVVKLPGNGSEHVTENSQDAFSLGLLAENMGAVTDEHG